MVTVCNLRFRGRIDSSRVKQQCRVCFMLTTSQNTVQLYLIFIESQPHLKIMLHKIVLVNRTRFDFVVRDITAVRRDVFGAENIDFAIKRESSLFSGG